MRVLAIGAHFDDIELGCGGALLRHASENDDITPVVATKSGYKNIYNKHSRSNKTGFLEQKINAKILNAKLICGNFNTLELYPSKNLINFLIKIAKDLNPDIIYTHFYGDEHLDHQAIGIASKIAFRNSKLVLSYMSNIYNTCPQFQPNYFIDISSFFERKKRLINNYKSEIITHKHWIKQIEHYNGLYGIKERKKYVEPFMIIRLLKEEDI